MGNISSIKGIKNSLAKSVITLNSKHLLTNSRIGVATEIKARNARHPTQEHAPI